MRLPPAQYGSNKTANQIIGFKGLNRMPMINKGELSFTKNISTEFLPCLTARNSRVVTRTLTAGHALFSSKDKLCWVDGTDFVYDGVVKGTVTAGSKSMCVFNDLIIIMPDKKYYDYVGDTFDDIGTGTYPADGSCPDMDYVCEYMNRVWGVKGSNIYASKLGDALNWTTFLGLETDAYATDVSTEGDFTGIYPYANHVVITKPDCVHEVYGYKPSNFQVQKTSNKGSLYGKTLCEVQGILLFQGRDTVYGYTGSVPRPVSLELNEKYSTATAGTDGRRYYLSTYNGTACNLYVYDTVNQVWIREDSLQVKDFTYLNGFLYALAADNKIYRFNTGSEIIDWEIETERFTEYTFDKKTEYNINIRADLSSGSSMSVYSRADNEDYKLINTVTADKFRTFELYIIPRRVDSFQIKITGTGPFKLYELERRFHY